MTIYITLSCNQEDANLLETLGDAKDIGKSERGNKSRGLRVLCEKHRAGNTSVSQANSKRDFAQAFKDFINTEEVSNLVGKEDIPKMEALFYRYVFEIK